MCKDIYTSLNLQNVEHTYVYTDIYIYIHEFDMMRVFLHIIIHYTYVEENLSFQLSFSFLDGESDLLHQKAGAVQAFGH